MVSETFVYMGSCLLVDFTGTQTLACRPVSLLESVNSILCHIDFCMHACRVEDYWEGYKNLCYAYYSHSLQHESNFWQCKLGAWLS